VNWLPVVSAGCLWEKPEESQGAEFRGLTQFVDTEHAVIIRRKTDNWRWQLTTSSDN
jgi:hypothetical protein